MALNYINVDYGRTLGRELLSCIGALRENQDRLRQLKEIMDNMVDGTGTLDSDYASLETNFGVVPNVTAGQKGRSVYNLSAGAVSELAADTSFASLIDYIVHNQ
jgi:hypothetical protein